MQSTTFADFLWQFMLLAVVGGAIAQIIGNLVTPFFQRRLGMLPDKTDSTGGTRRTPEKPWSPRMWLYYLVGLAALMVTLLLWTAFWTPILDAVVNTNQPPAYQILIPPISALIYISLCFYLVDLLLRNILYYESRFQRKKYSYGSFFYSYAAPLGIISVAVVIIEASYVGFELLRKNTILTAGGLMLLTYASVFAITVIWLVLVFLLKEPLLWRAFEDSESELKV